MTNPHRRAPCLLCLGLAGLFLGCGDGNDKPASPSNGPPRAGGGPQGQGNMKPPKMDFGPFTGGKKVFAENGCARCHAVNGVRLMARGGPMGGGFPGPGGGRPPMGGGFRGPGGGPPTGGFPGPGGPGKGRKPPPDLGKVGEEPEHTVAWLMKYVRNPKSVDKKATMPAFKKIKEEDLRSLAEFLHKLK